VAANFAAMVNRNLVLGRFNSNWYPLNGALDEFRVYNRVITVDEVEALATNDVGAITLINNGPEIYCAGDDLTFSYTTQGDFGIVNQFVLQMSNASGSFAFPIVLASETQTSGTINTVVPTGTPSGTGYRFRMVSSLPNLISEQTEPVTINGVLGDIPNPAVFRYIGNVDGRDYYKSVVSQTWTNARTTCLNNGGYLATIPNAAVNQLIFSNAGATRMYVGLNDLVTEGLYTWQNDDPFNYSNWAAGQPDNASNEDVVEVRNDNGQWNDIGGTGVREFIMVLSPAGLNRAVCAGGELALNAFELSGSTYLWTGPNGFSSQIQNPVILNAGSANSGVYSLSYSLGGCEAETPSINVVVNQLPNNLGASSTLPASLQNGLVLHYPMNGNANDASGNNINGNLVGGVTAVEDRFGAAGGALAFNGTNGHITLPAGVYFNGSDFTVNTWVRKVSNNSWSRIFDFGNGNANNNVLLALSNGTTGRPACEIYAANVSAGQVGSPSATVQNNQWQLLTYTWSANNARIFINGQMVAQGVQGSPVDIIRTINYIGRSNWANDAYLNARLDDFRLYNRVLSKSEINALLLEQPGNLSAGTMQPVVCSGAAAQIYLANPQPGVSYQLRNADTQVNVGAVQMGGVDTLLFNTGNLLSTTPFFFVATNINSGCSVDLSPNIIAIAGVLPEAPTATGDEVCNEGEMTLSASGVPVGGSYLWYTVPTGGTPISGENGASLETGNVSTSVTYYVSVTDAAGCESPRTAVVGSVINPLSPPVDLVSGLILHYTFDGTLSDFSGNDYHATVFGANSYVNDRNGNSNSALNSTASGAPGNNYLSAGNPAKVQQLTNQVTISGWIRQTQTWFGSSGNDGQMPLINKWDGNTGMWMGLRMINPNNMTNRVRWRVNSTTWVESNTNVPVGVWHHVVCTYNGAQLRIYQNGVLTATLNHTGSISNTGVALMLGRQANGTPSGGITYRGDWDEVKIYNRALNLNEIQTIYNNESVAFSNAPFCDEEGDLTLSTFDFPDATYQWTGPNGFSSTEQNPPVITNADSATYAGLYNLEVTVNGCTSASQEVNVVIYEFPGAPTTTDASVCGSGNATLLASGAAPGASYRWYLLPEGGTPIGGQTTGSLTINNLNATTERYVSIIRNGCEGPRSVVTAFYYSNVSTDIEMLGSSVCAGESEAVVTLLNSESEVLYQAYSGATAVSELVDGGGDLNISINSDLLEDGENTITIQAAYPGCGPVNLDNTAMITILAGPEASISSSSTAICAGESISLNATIVDGAGYQWLLNGNAIIGANESNYSALETGIYQVEVTDDCVNISNSIVIVSGDVNTSPIVGESIVSCSSNNETYSVSNTSGSTYVWSVPLGAEILSGQGTNSIQVNFFSNFGVVSVVETTGAGCVGELEEIEVQCVTSVVEHDEMSLKIYPNPAGESFTIELSGFTSVSIMLLFDSYGKEVRRQLVQNQSVIAIEELADGMYFGQIWQGGQMVTFKLIKH
jgi:hypothetical protein